MDQYEVDGGVNRVGVTDIKHLERQTFEKLISLVGTGTPRNVGKNFPFIGYGTGGRAAEIDRL